MTSLSFLVVPLLLLLRPDALVLKSSDDLTNEGFISLPYKEGVARISKGERLGVYLYPVPERYHEGMLRHFLPGEDGIISDVASRAWANSKEHVALAWTNSEIGIQRCLASRAQSEKLTPEDADFLYVPFYPSLCHAAEMAPSLFNDTDQIFSACDEFSSLLNNVVIGEQSSARSFFAVTPQSLSSARLHHVGLQRLPQLWRRAGGRDHVLPAWLPSYTPYLKEERLLVPGGPVRLLGDFSVVHEPWGKVQEDEYMHRFGYAQKRDLLFPWHLLRAPAEAVAPPQDVPRGYFMYYAGSTSTLVKKANKLRVKLAKLVKVQNDSKFVEMTSRFPPSDFQEQMRNSVFCPAPPGDTQLATRHYDAIIAGCIPVVLTEGRVPLPYDNVLDWTRFAILLPTSSVEDGSFVEVLRAKTQEEIQELRKWVYAVRPYFMVTPNCSSPSAVDMLLHQLAQQKGATLNKMQNGQTSWSGMTHVLAALWFASLALLCFVATCVGHKSL